MVVGGSLVSSVFLPNSGRSGVCLTGLAYVSQMWCVSDKSGVCLTDLMCVSVGSGVSDIMWCVSDIAGACLCQIWRVSDISVSV